MVADVSDEESTSHGRGDAGDVDSAVAAASLGNTLATVLPLDDDLMQLDSTPPVPTALVQKSQSASTLELARAPASDSKFQLQRSSVE